MAGVHVELAVFGDVQFAREIDRVAGRPSEMEPAWRSIFDRMLEINREQFLSEGMRSSGGWDPLNPKYVAWKAAHGLDTRILWRTHALFEAMGFESDANNEIIYGGDWAVFRVTGEPGEYGPYLQGGTDHMPARPPWALTELDREEIMKEIQRWILKGELGFFI